MALLYVLIFVRETCCMLIFLFVKLVHWLFFREADFLHWKCCILIFSWTLLRSDFCSWSCLHVDLSLFDTYTFISFLVKLIFSWNVLYSYFCSWNLLCADFCSKNFLHVDFSLFETFTLVFFNMKLISANELFVCWFLFVEPVAYWFLLVIFFACWVVSSWCLYIDFSLSETISHRTCCLLIFDRGVCCTLLFFFVLKACCMFIFHFLKVIRWFFFSWSWFYSCSLLHTDFCSWNFLLADLCSWNLLHVDFSLPETYKLIFLFMKLFFYMEVVVCW